MTNGNVSVKEPHPIHEADTLETTLLMGWEAATGPETPARLRPL